MKISLNVIAFLNQHYKSAGNPAPDGVDAVVEKIGAQLGAVEEITQFGRKFEGVIIAKVVSCEQHPNADRLHVCKLDDGKVADNVERDEAGLVQVVCGAPNVREGLLVAWLPPGSTVPSTFNDDPLVLEARELRGVVSNGMLASAKELGISDSHDGILEITPNDDQEFKPGTTFVDAFYLQDDVIIDIENKMFTHRPDCFGWLGVARELEGIQGRAYKSPDWYTSNPAFASLEAPELKLEVRNEIPELVPRFSAIVLSGIELKPSPTWLQVTLARDGLRPINNIVDYTNYFMLLTGQPLHAYDYDKVKALDGGDYATIVVRNPRDNERLTLLSGKTIDPRQEAIMIASASKLIGLGGVMGGVDTEVDASTKNIILECANFDMYSIRRTSMHHGIFSDAVTRFNKGQSPLQTLAVLAKIVDEIRTFAGGKVASVLIDDNHLPQATMARASVHPPITITSGFVNARLGLNLTSDAMSQLLNNVEFDARVSDDTLVVTAPFWRTDIELREDVVEEVGRLYGFDKLPQELPMRAIEPAVKDAMLELKSKIRQVLSKAGANEVLTYSFVHGKLLEKASQDPALALKLSNALSPDLQYFRLSLTPSLLDKVHMNIKAGYDQFALFEIGKGHHLQSKDEHGLPIEFEAIDLVVTAGPKVSRGTAFYQARNYVVALAAGFGVELDFVPLTETPNDPALRPYDLSRSALVKVRGTDQILGVVGEYKTSVLRNFKLPAYSAGFGIGTAELLAASQSATGGYIPLPRFPSTEQDICLKVSSSLLYSELYEMVDSQLASLKPENSLLQVRALDIYQRQDDVAHKQVTFRASFASYERTLTDKEVSGLLDQLAVAAGQKFGAEKV